MKPLFTALLLSLALAAPIAAQAQDFTNGLAGADGRYMDPDAEVQSVLNWQHLVDEANAYRQRHRASVAGVQQRMLPIAAPSGDVN